jgi:cysteine desulfurase
MAKALELAYADFETRVSEYRRLRDRLIDGILRVPGAHLTGAPGGGRLPNHASFVFEGVEANMLLMHLDMAGIAVSSGSACNTGNPEPSDVLIAMGYPPDLALGSLRLTVGKQTTEADIDRVLEVLPDAVNKVREVRARQSTASLSSS